MYIILSFMMSLVILRESLLNPLKFLANLVSKKTISRLSQYIRLDTDNLTLKIRLELPDMSVALIAPLESGEHQLHGTMVDVKKLVSIVSSLPTASLVTIFQQDDKKLSILSNRTRSQFTISPPSLEVDDLLAKRIYEENLNTPSHIVINSAQLTEAIQYIKVLMSKNQTRAYLQAMMVEFYQEQLTLVGTDGHRMAVCMLKTESFNKHYASVVVPRLPILQLHKLLSKIDDHKLQVTLAQNIISFSTDRYCYQVKLLITEYPDYRNFIKPVGPIGLLKVNNKQLQEALIRFCSLGLLLKDCIVKITLSSVKMYMESQDLSQDKLLDEIDIEYTGQDIELGLNAKYILEVIREIKEADLNIEVYGKDKALLLRSNGKSCQAIFIVSPVRL